MWWCDTSRPTRSLYAASNAAPYGGNPVTYGELAEPIVKRWFTLAERTSAMYFVAQARYAVMPPRPLKYASLLPSGSLKRSHIAICGSESYRAMIARTTSTWCAYCTSAVLKSRQSAAAPQWPRTGTRYTPAWLAACIIRPHRFQNQDGLCHEQRDRVGRRIASPRSRLRADRRLRD